MRIRKVSQSSGVVAKVIDNFLSTSSTDALSAGKGKELNTVINEIDDLYGKTTLWTGNLLGGQSITLDTTKVKNNLKIYAVCNSQQSLTYEINTLIGSVIFGGGVSTAYDDSGNGTDYYASECKYTLSTGVLEHTKTGYFTITSGTYTSRNERPPYKVVKIETYN